MAQMIPTSWNSCLCMIPSPWVWEETVTPFNKQNMTKVKGHCFLNWVQNTVTSILRDWYLPPPFPPLCQPLPPHLSTLLTQAPMQWDASWGGPHKREPKGDSDQQFKKMRPQSNSSRGTNSCQHPSESGSSSSPAEPPDYTAALSDTSTVACGRPWSKGSSYTCPGSWPHKL